MNLKEFEQLINRVPSHREWMVLDLTNPIAVEILKEEGYL